MIIRSHYTYDKVFFARAAALPRVEARWKMKHRLLNLGRHFALNYRPILAIRTRSCQGENTCLYTGCFLRQFRLKTFCQRLNL